MRATVLKVVMSAAVAVIVMTAGAFAQDTAYVPFRVNVNAKITASQEGVEPVSVDATARTSWGGADTLKLPLANTDAVRYYSGARQSKTPVITASRGNITLNLPAQSYQNAEIALYSVNGKRVLRGKADATNAANAITRRNIAAGVYILSVKGTNGGAFTTRLTHSGGNMSVKAAFGTENALHERRLAKSAAAGDWGITVSASAAGYEDSVPVSAAGYKDSVYTLNITAAGWAYTLQIINLRSSDWDVTTFVDDRDNQTYKKVKIGNQTWMAENLNYDVPDVTTHKCYNNSADSCAKYGRLYTWNTAMNGAPAVPFGTPFGVQGVCPAGWHLPVNDEWTTLKNYVGRDAQKLKSTTDWMHNYNGTDEYGFAALPGGQASVTDKSNIGTDGYWWSASAPFSGKAYLQRIYLMDQSFRDFDNDYTSAYLSVRCVEDEDSVTYTVTFNANGGSGTVPSLSVQAGYRITLPDGSELSRNGYKFGGWNTDSSGTGIIYRYKDGMFIVPYYKPASDITLYAMWDGGGATFTDERDGKIYRIVTIGSRVWMAENLNYEYSGGVCVGEGGGVYAMGTGETTMISEALIQAYCDTYGRLYTWSMAMGGRSGSSAYPSGVQGICPTGWHLPSAAEWEAFLEYTGKFGGALRARTTWHYDTKVTRPAASNIYGFSALAAGRRLYSNGEFGLGQNAFWWSATEGGNNAANNAYILRIMDVYPTDESDNSVADVSIGLKADGCSVRCVQD